LEGTPTFTGGMPFAGGPYNNYVLQATCRAAELLRQGESRTALISSVSGLLTKQGFGVWSRDPAPQGYCNADLSAAVGRECPALEVAEAVTGPGVIVGYTVLHGRGLAPRGVALLDLEDGRRALVTTQDPSVLASFEAEEWVGRRVFSEGHQLRLGPA
jgi:acetyl-CoA C-acetyltransferase